MRTSIPCFPSRACHALGLALLLGALASPAAAETTPQAREWLEKLTSFYERGPFTTDYSASFDLAAGGTPAKGRMDGRITYGDRRHMRMEMRLEMASLPGLQGNGNQPIEMKIASVSDGEFTWTELDMPAMGGKQVMKLGIDNAAELAGGQLGMGGLQNVDPIAQLEAMTEVMSFEVVERSAGRVTLRGKLAENADADLKQLRSLGIDAVVLVLDAETGAPLELRAGDEPKVRMEFSNLKQVERGSLPPGVFEYKPPDGVPVIDLAAIIGTQGGRPPG